MRSGDSRRSVRASVLWGSGKRGEGSRSNALWGSGKRRMVLCAKLVLVVLVPLGAAASPSKQDDIAAYVTPTLLSSAQANPGSSFKVIVQGKAGNQAAKAVADVLGTQLKAVRSLNSMAARGSSAVVAWQRSVLFSPSLAS